MSENKGFPPWAWIGCGCVGAIAALVAIAVGLGFWGVNKAREFGESMKDPEEREERALSALGASELPDGYYAVVAFSVPFVFDFAMLADEPPKENGEPAMGEHGFIFVSFPAFGEGDEELYDFFEGRSEDVQALRRENMDLDLEERIDRGLIERQTQIDPAQVGKCIASAADLNPTDSAQVYSKCLVTAERSKVRIQINYPTFILQVYMVTGQPEGH